MPKTNKTALTRQNKAQIGYRKRECGKLTHELKILPEYYDAVEAGIKTFEIRKNDRDYKVGDFLRLREWVAGSWYTGREITKQVVYIVDNPEYCKSGYIVMGIK
jgi:hypothetical protein